MLGEEKLCDTGDGARLIRGLPTGERPGDEGYCMTGEGALPLGSDGDVTCLIADRRNFGLVAGDSARASSW